MKGFNEQLVVLYPYLMSLAMKRCKNLEQAEDLVQDTMVKALKHTHAFTLGTNLRAWTSVILHNTFLSDMRRLKGRNLHMTALQRQDYAVDAKEQFYHVALKQATERMRELPAEQCRALEMIGLEGLTYEDAAEAANVSVVTVKSRVNRARAHLQEHRPE